MKILVVTPRLPYPPYKGDQLRSYFFIKELSKKGHEIDLVSYVENKSERQYVSELEKYCRSVRTILNPKWWSVLKMMLGIFSKIPFQVLYYTSVRMHLLLSKMIRNNSYDTVHLVLARMMEFGPCFGDLPVVVDHIDSISLNMERRFRKEKGLLKRTLIGLEWQKIKQYEKAIRNKHTFAVITSPVDARSLQYNRISVVSNGVDTNAYCPSQSEKTVDTLFTGNMSYFPNVDAARNFAVNILHHVQSALPNTNFHIAGINPAKSVKELTGHKNIHVAGFVENMTEYLNKAKVFVAPLESGTGIQNKILEAMSCGIPVVTTSFGNAGIRAMHNQEILVANDPKDFAKHVVALLLDEQKRNKIGQAGRKLVKEQFSWLSRAELLEHNYRRAIRLNAARLEEIHNGIVPIELYKSERVEPVDPLIYRRFSEFSRRIFDVFGSLIGLALSSPLWLLVGIAIYLTDGKPIIFKQKRMGKGGSIFSLYKFRTMIKNAEKTSGAVFATKNDPRVTRFGRFLRISRLDEIPQLVNVLRGNMSLIGPRPERPEFSYDFADSISFYDKRLNVKPGLTGWAQVKCPYAASVNDTKKKLEYDLFYIKNRSVSMTVAVLLQTITVVLTGRGAR